MEFHEHGSTDRQLPKTPSSPLRIKAMVREFGGIQIVSSIPGLGSVYLVPVVTDRAITVGLLNVNKTMYASTWGKETRTIYPVD